MKVAYFAGDLERSVLGGELLFGFGVVAETFKGFDGEDLLREDVTELAGGLVGDFLERRQSHAFGHFALETGHGLVGDAAGVDELEVAEIGGDVEGESVGGDSAGDVNADGSDFAFAGGAGLVRILVVLVKAAPDAGESGDAAGTDAIDTAEADESFFHHADEIDRTEAASAGVLERAQVEDGIADELTRAVVGDVAPAIDVVECDAAAFEEFVGGEDVGAAGIATEREYGRVFEEE